MNRDPEAVLNRRNFIKRYFQRRKAETPGISIKEISVELSDWYLFISTQTIIKEYHSTN